MKGIRILLLFVIVLLCGVKASAQGVKIYKTDGTTITIPSAVLDSIINAPAKEFVDLGLSVKWATCNVGADSPEQYGSYFAWGDIYPKASYCKADSLPEKVMFDISGNNKYDAARVNWGKPARIPTNDEINELCEKCKWQRIKLKGVFGMLITGPNGNSIFLPAAGFYIDTYPFADGSDGYYWSSTPIEHADADAYYLDFDKKFYYWGNWLRRYLGQTIRPVANYSED